MSALSVCGPASQVEARQFRQAMSQFATGVTVITAALPDGSLHGVTINSFNSVSLAPPLVLWSLAQEASSMAVFMAAPSYVINVLAGDQIELAQRFAATGTACFDKLPFALSDQGVPVLSGTVAWFECSQRNRYPEGDHVIFVGQVERCHSHPDRTLGFHRGRFIAI